MPTCAWLENIQHIGTGYDGQQQSMVLNKNRQWQAILLAALFFSLSHVHISLLLAIATFVLSLFWGWMYTRHSTLIGVIASHWLLTYFAIFVVGFDF